MTDPRATLVIPAYQEGESIGRCLRVLADAVTIPFEALVVVDTDDDSTIPHVEKFAIEDDRFRVVVQTYGRGPANAIRFGMDQAAAPVIVVTMADGSDDVRIIDDLIRLTERGFAVVAPSRYMAGGQQVGGPKMKASMSRLAGRSLHLLARIGTHDPTNSFKAYSTAFVRSVDIESRDGFELSLELTAKARRRRLPIAEIPSIWLDRTEGESNFRMKEWLPKYVEWYLYAFGGPVGEDTRRRRGRRKK